MKSTAAAQGKKRRFMATKWEEIKRKKTEPAKAALKLFLDDVRVPSDVYPDGGTWMLCRDIESCKRFLSLGVVSHISLDGDMGKIDNRDIPGGVELLNWMHETCTWPTTMVLVHSQNPVKANIMRQIIDNHFVSEDDLKEYTIDDK